VRLLLDTNALIWSLTAPDRLSSRAADAIKAEANDVYVSAISVWEIAMKRSHKRLEAPDDLESQLDEKRFKRLPVEMHHAHAIEFLPHHHGDPFDRMLIAQAQVEGLTIVTSDREMRRYQVALLPAI
jgi:PIN domain nuclease of toxin-antitoxin system